VITNPGVNRGNRSGTRSNGIINRSGGGRGNSAIGVRRMQPLNNTRQGISTRQGIRSGSSRGVSSGRRGSIGNASGRGQSPTVRRRSFFNTTPRSGSVGRGRTGVGAVATRNLDNRGVRAGTRRGANGRGLNGRNTANLNRRGDLNRGVGVGRRSVGRGGAVSPYSFSSNLPDRYFNAYNRPNRSPGRVNWLNRNGFPRQAFGLGRPAGRIGVSRRGALGVRGLGFQHFGRHDRGFFGRRDLLGRAGSFAVGVGVGRNIARNRFDRFVDRRIGLGWGGLGWGGCVNRGWGFNRYCFPRRRVTFVNTWGGWGCSPGFVNTGLWGGGLWAPGVWTTGLWASPWIGGGDDIEYENTYVTNNYYGTDQLDPNATTGYAVPQSGTVTPLPGTGQVMGQSQAPGQVTPPAGFVSHANDALRAFAAGNYALARRELVRAILAKPDDPEMIMLYGYAHFATGDYLVAALAIRRAIEADPTLIDQPIDLTALYPNQSDYWAHLSLLGAHIQADLNDVDGRFLAGFVRYAAGDATGAGTYFAECAAAAPSDLLYVIMRDAALRAGVSQRGAQRVPDALRDNARVMNAASDGEDVAYLEMEPVYP
jgi:hypothetical protein